MKNRGFTLVEIMIVTAISLSLAAVIFGVFIVLNNGLAINSAYTHLKQQSQIAMENIQNYLEKSSADTITISDCQGDCRGNKIIFQTPVVTDDAVSGTVFDYLGNTKMGAFFRMKSGSTFMAKGDHFIFSVPTNNNKLVLSVIDKNCDPNAEIIIDLEQRFLCDQGGEGEGEGCSGTSSGGGLFLKLFDKISGIKQAYARIEIHSNEGRGGGEKKGNPNCIKYAMPVATDFKQVKFSGNADKTLIKIEMTLEKDSVLGNPITYSAESETTPLN